MKIACFSDTHTRHEEIQLPECDIALFTGDCLNTGKNSKNLKRFIQWFDKQPAKHKVMIAGNHDFLFERQPEVAKYIVSKTDVIYLENSSVEIEGLKIYGTPIQEEFCNWAFNRPSDIRSTYYSRIPEDTDILLTHCPPFGILDKVDDVGLSGDRVGCPILLSNVTRVKPLIHAFGHIHGSFGVERGIDTVFVNGASLNENYYKRSETPYHVLYLKNRIIDIEEGDVGLYE